MKKLSLLVSSLVFFFLFFFSSKTALAKGTDCYVGSTKVGYLYSGSHSNDFRHYNFFAPGDSASLSFTDLTGDVRIDEQVYFKVGNSGWQLTTKSGNYYYGDFTVDNNPCGNCWLNARWRSNTDGQLHYCNLLMPKYTPGKTVDPYLNASCLYSNCTAQKAPNEDSRVYAYWLYPGFPDTTNCTSYKLQVENRPYSFSTIWTWNPSLRKFCGVDDAFSDASLPPDGKVDTYISYSGPPPAVDPNTITYYNNYNRLRFYNFISNSYCGSAIVDVTPTPTPTIEYSYCESGACKIRYTSPGLTACKGIVNGCFCANVNCQINSDCVTQTGANSCNICNPITHKCGFSPTPTPSPTPTSTPTPTPIPTPAWFQVQGGDVHAEGDINSRIPSSSLVFAVDDGTGNAPGIVSYAGLSDFGSGDVSNLMLANDSNALDYSYNFFYQRMKSYFVD